MSGDTDPRVLPRALRLQLRDSLVAPIRRHDLLIAHPRPDGKCKEKDGSIWTTYEGPERLLGASPVKGKDGIARAIYVTAKGERVVVVHAFVKKAQRTPAGALAIARERAKEVL